MDVELKKKYHREWARNKRRIDAAWAEKERVRDRIRRLENLESRLAYNRAWHHKNKEKVNASRRANRKIISPVARRAKLLKNFGLSDEQYQRMLDKQNGLCAICKNPETHVDRRLGAIRKMAVDHCHKSNKVRGLLCGSCNLALGLFKDSVETFRNAIFYLEDRK